jgi:hypothetical protein
MVVVIILIPFLLSGCNSFQSVEQHVVGYHYSAEDISEIRIELDTGQINLLGGNSSEITVNGSLVNADSIIEDYQDSIIYLTFPESEIGDEITIQVPPGVVVNINSFSADVIISNFSAQLEVSSVAGDIILDAFTGDALLWAGRGDVEIVDGNGEVVVIGEHGTLSVSGFEGDVSMTTIMGTLRYLGSENTSDSATLESDHGPVEVLLPETANFDIQVNTTSGYVTCLGPDLAQTVSGCEGIIGEGTGRLDVRTVSGRVDLKVISTEAEAQDN